MFYFLYLTLKFVVQDSRGYTVKLLGIVSGCCALPPPSLSCPLRLRYLDPTFCNKCNLLSFAAQQKTCFMLDTTELFLFSFIFWFAAQPFNWLIFKDNMEECDFVHMYVFIIAGINLLLSVV